MLILVVEDSFLLSLLRVFGELIIFTVDDLQSVFLGLLIKFVSERSREFVVYPGVSKFLRSNAFEYDRMRQGFFPLSDIVFVLEVTIDVCLSMLRLR